MKVEEILAKKLSKHTAEMVEFLESQDIKSFSSRIEEGKWSILENLEHLFICEKGAKRFMKAEAEAIEVDLVASEKNMRSGFGDLSKKFVAGNAILPLGRFSSFEEWKPAFLANRETLLQLGNEMGWKGQCMGWEHPFFGFMTRAEWVVFSTVHADRHIDLLKLSAKEKSN